MAGGAFSSKARLETTPARDRQRRYLASHRYAVEPGRELHEPPGGALRLVLEVALSLLERGYWTIPSWHVEKALAARGARELGWEVAPLRPPEYGGLGLRVPTKQRTI